MNSNMMKGNIFLLLFAIGASVLTIKKIVIFHPLWMIGSFLIWCVLNYISIHKRNKDKRTPQAVYMS